MRKENKKAKKPKNQKLLVKLGDFITNHRYLFLILFLGLSVFCIFNIKNVTINESIVSYLPDESSYKDGKALYTIELDEASDEELTQVKTDLENVVADEEYSIYSEAFDDSMDGIGLALGLSVIVVVVILLVTSKTYFEPVIAFIVFAISIVLNMGSNFIFGEISYITQSIAVIMQLALSIDYIIIFMNQFMKEIGDTDDKILAIKKTVTKTIPEIFASSLTTISGLLALVFMQLKIGEDIGLVLSKGIICSLLTVIFVMPSLLAIFTKVILKLKKKEKVKKSNELGEFILKSRKSLLPGFVVLVIIAMCLIPSYNYVYNPTSANSIHLSENAKAQKNIEEEFGASNNLIILVKNDGKDYDRELALANELEENEKITTITSLGSYKIDGDIALGTKVNYLEAAKLFGIDDKTSQNLYQLYAKQNNEMDKLSNLSNYKVTIIDLFSFLYDNLQTLPLSAEVKTQITTYHDLLAETEELLESDQYSRILLNLDAPAESEEAYELVGDIREIAEKHYDEVKLVGSTVNAIDLESSFTSDNVVITGMTILFIGIILLCTFKSTWLTLLLILTIEGSILINFGIMALAGKEIFFMAYIVVSAIQMGATIDYAIVIATRYKTLRTKYDKKRSTIGTLEDSMPAVITSGSILLISSFLIGFISSSSVVSSIGLFLGVGTIVSLLATIFVLPAVLYLFDSKFIKQSADS